MLEPARFPVASLVVGVTLVFAQPFHAQSSRAEPAYTIVDLDSLPGSVSSHAGAVNDRGEVIGFSDTTAVAWTRDGLVELGGLLASEPDSVPRSLDKRGDIVGDSLFSRSIWPFQRHGFLWRDGTMTDLGTLPGKTDSYAGAINDRGEIAGTAYAILSGSNLVLWKDGAIHDLGPVQGSSAWVTGMNNRRQIVGYAAGSKSIPFLWQDGVLTYLGSFADPVSSMANAINDRGEIAGSLQASDGTARAVLWRDGAMVDLGQLPGSFYTAATGINNRGQVVGFALDLLNPGIHNRAFLWEDGRMIELAPRPGSAWAIASAINDHGEITGFEADPSGYGDHAIMWIPKKGR
jgi:probable HAF family extracellular repeat protein